MGLEKINGGRIYLDTNIFIYAVENVQEYREIIFSIYSRVKETRSTLVTSELTLAECLEHPFKNNDKNSIENYERTISNSKILSSYSITKDILKESARIKALYKNKLPDSIHLATALIHNCDLFITNDLKIKKPDGIEILTFKDLP